MASYYVSGRMFEQDGIYNAGDEKYQQFNVKAKGIVNVKPWLRVENTTDFMYRYSHQTMRGGSELTVEGNADTSKGLDIEYATSWSYGWQELPNLMIPNFNGGSSAGAVNPSKSETVKLLKRYGQTNVREVAKTLPLYWGPAAFHGRTYVCRCNNRFPVPSRTFPVRRKGQMVDFRRDNHCHIPRSRQPFHAVHQVLV